jgi:hypothetical protein
VSKTAHTPGRLRLSKFGTLYHADGSEFVKSEANLRRVVALWNLHEHWPTERIEAEGQAMAEAAERLRERGE